MSLLKFTERDIKGAVVMKPSRQTLHIDSVEEETKVDEKGSKVQWTVKMSVAKGEYQGVPMTDWLHSRGAVFAVGFVEAALGRKLQKDEEVDPKSCEGKYIDAFIINGEDSNNRTINKVKEYFPSQMNASQQAV